MNFRKKDSSAAEQSSSSKLVKVNRVSKVVKGGKRFSFSALVVAGDKKGKVGYAMGSAPDVSEAVRKATERATRSMVRIPIKDKRTIFHDIKASYGASKVIIRSAAAGSGIIAGECMGTVFELAGIRDIVAKSLGSSTPCNVVKATLKALSNIQVPRHS
jgi:small subunit ribosomal protein S5